MARKLCILTKVRNMKNSSELPHIDELVSYFANIEKDSWQRTCDVLFQAYEANQRVWLAGNGGNAANAYHFATDWNKGLFVATGKPLESRTLGDNPALMSALSNDLPFEQIFSEQLRMWAAKGDVVVLMSGGGTSINILKAADTAHELGLKVIGLTGGKGMLIHEKFDYHIHVPTDNIQIVEDVHAAFGHVVFKYICSKLEV